MSAINQTENTPSSLDALSEFRQQLYATAQTLLVQNKDQSLTRVLLVGITGAGKTTLLHSLVGKKLYGIDNGIIVLEPGPGDVLFTISHNADAGTVTPNEIKDEPHGIEYFDCPGFLDPDLDKRIIHAVTLDQLLQPPCKIKILLVLSYSDLRSKGTLAKEAFDVLTGVMPNMKELEQAIGCVITKAPKTVDPVKFLNMSLSSKSKRNPLIDFIVGHPEKIFTFPAADVVGEYTLFNDKDRLIQFLQTAPVVNPKHQLSLDDEAFNCCLIPLTSALRSDMTRVVNTIVYRVSDVGNKSDNPADVKRSLDGLIKLEKAAKSGWAAFVPACDEFKTWSAELSNLVTTVQYFGQWSEFLAQFKKDFPRLEKNYGFSFDDTLKTLQQMKSSLQKRYDKQFSAKAKEAEKSRHEENLAVVEEVGELVGRALGVGGFLLFVVLCCGPPKRK